MKSIAIVFMATLALFAGGASGATISMFNKTTNDGVYTLEAGQVLALGYDPAQVDRIGFLRIREGNGTTFNDGDTFDQNSVYSSVTSNSGSIVALLNGTSAELSYTGNTFDVLGTTTVGTSNSYYAGVAFLFHSSSGNIVFKGTSTFNGGQTRGVYPNISAVPIPAAVWLFGSALIGMAGVGYRRKRQA